MVNRSLQQNADSLQNNAPYSFTGPISATALQLTLGAVAGQRLTSDAQGNVSWSNLAPEAATGGVFSSGTAWASGRSLLQAPSSLQSNAPLTMTGQLTTPALKLTASPAAGAVLTSDAAGNATWQAPGAITLNAPTAESVVMGGGISIAAGRSLIQQPPSLQPNSSPQTGIATGGQTINSTTPADLTGMTITVVAANSSSLWIVLGTLDLSIAGGTSVLTGSLLVDGTVQPGAIVAQSTGAARYPALNQWIITGLTPGVHVIKMQGSVGVVASTFTVNATNSTIDAVQLI